MRLLELDMLVAQNWEDNAFEMKSLSGKIIILIKIKVGKRILCLMLVYIIHQMSSCKMHRNLFVFLK